MPKGEIVGSMFVFSLVLIVVSLISKEVLCKFAMALMHKEAQGEPNQDQETKVAWNIKWSCSLGTLSSKALLLYFIDPAKNERLMDE